MGSFIEFGDFSISNFLSTCEGVQLPSSWSQEDSFNPLLSFFADSEENNSNLPFDELVLTFMTSNNASKSTSVVQCNAARGDVNEKLIATKMIQSEDVLPSHGSSAPNDIAATSGIKSAFVHDNDISKSDNMMMQSNLTSVSNLNLSEVNSPASKSGIDETCSGSNKIYQQVDNAHQNVEQFSEEMKPQSDHFVQNEPGKELLPSKSATNNMPTDVRRPTNGNGVSKPNYRRENSVQKPILVKPEDDPLAKFFADEISKLKLVCKPKAFVPRGLFNSNNWCYINATLQALLACPPFFHMLKKLSFFRKENRQKTSTPILDCFVIFASEFKPLSFQYCQQYGKDIKPGVPFTPGYMYDMLTVIKSSLSIVGGQEDAEEFLSCILNGFHEEIQKLFSCLPNGIEVEGNHLNNFSDEEYASSHNEIDNAFTSAVHCDDETPISKIFRGKMCITVKRSGQKPSVSYESFFTLPIDVSSDYSWSIEDALYALTDGESCDDDSEPSVIRQQTIETLPPILVLHLKRFIYNKSGGSLKVDKKVHFKTDLVIENDWLSESAPVYTMGQRSYKLFAVVYHHGEKATGGHYSADVFHIGIVSWLRIDDQHIWPIKQADVVTHSPKRTPYLLYYRQINP